MSGKQAFAPCGHTGEVIFGNYVACKICDGKKGPAIEIQLPNGYPVNPKKFEDFELDPPKAIYNFVSDNPAKVTIDNGANVHVAQDGVALILEVTGNLTTVGVETDTAFVMGQLAIDELKTLFDSGDPIYVYTSLGTFTNMQLEMIDLDCREYELHFREIV